MRHESAHYSALERFLSSAGLLRTTSVLLQPDGRHLTLVHYTRLMGNAHLCEFVSRKRQRRQEDEDKEKKKRKFFIPSLSLLLQVCHPNEASPSPLRLTSSFFLTVPPNPSGFMEFSEPRWFTEYGRMLNCLVNWT